MEKKIRVGTIGSGFGAKVHAPIMSLHPGFEVISISTISRSNPEKIKEETGIEKVYDNWGEMLEKEKLDLVSITSAPYLHHEMVVESFKRGLHVLCEKPMAFNAIQTEEMIEAMKKADRLGFINFEFRFLPAKLKVKEVMDSGQLGRIMHIKYSGTYQGYHRVNKSLNWLGQKDKGDGMLGALGSHMIDSLLWWKMNNISSVYAQLPIHFTEYIDENGKKEIRTAEEAFQIIGDFEDRTTFTIDFILSSRNAKGWNLEIHGTNGTLIMTDDSNVKIGLGDNTIEEVEIEPLATPSEPLEEYKSNYYGAFYPKIEHLYKPLTSVDISPYLADFKNGHDVQLVLDAIRKSADEGCKVQL